MKYFITYGDDKFFLAKKRIANLAIDTGEFDFVITYGKEELSPQLRSSEIIGIPRGGGLWSWKPDVIYTTMKIAQDGDIIVYCDSGCTVQSCSEWSKFWKILETHDIIAQRLYQRNDHWTRKELLDYFSSNFSNWIKCYQYLATVIILKVTPFAREIVEEWRDIMIRNPNLAKDVDEATYVVQHDTFIENRHDQSIFSSIIYKYLSIPIYRKYIYTQWEHIEDYDIFCKQAVRATRFRQEQSETTKQLFVSALKRLVKDYIFKPFYYAPLQWWHSK
jgi:hypothetical protein